MKVPTIKTAKHFCEAAGAVGTIVIAFDRVSIAGSSYGKTASECKPLGRLLDAIVEAIEAGELPHPFDNESSVAAPSDFPGGSFIDDARAVLAMLDDLPELAEDFAEGVRERIEGMIEWSEDNDGFATDRMTDALSNMERGIERWQRWAVAVWLLPGAAS